VLAVGYLLVQAARATVVERHRLWVVLVLMFFSMLFWSFFEQAGTSINNFTDRNVDRVGEERLLTQADVGRTIDLELSQEQLGWPIAGKVFTMDQLDAARKADSGAVIPLTVAPEHVGMGIGGSEVPASTFQAANPTFILLFGLVFTMMWRVLGQRGLEPSTPVKFSLGLLQLGMGFGVLWYGAATADARGMVGTGWLVLGYMLHTTGELCLSPVGLSMVTKLSPARLVSTVMGAWFLATAYSGLFAAIIAALTGVAHGDGGELVIPPPIETVHVYGTVFGQIGIAATVSAALLLVLSPVLVKWMHGEK
jgi:POT family proton-dependent oligopeptide transporter